MTTNPVSPLSDISSVGVPIARTPAGSTTRFKSIDPIRVLREHMTFLIVTTIAGVILGVVTWASLFFTVPIYESSAQLLVTQAITQAWELPTMAAPTGRWDATQAQIETVAYRILSEDIISNTLLQREVRQTDWFKSFSGGDPEAREELKDKLHARPVSGTTLVRVWMRSIYKDDVDEIVDTATREFLKKHKAESDHLTTDYRKALLRERTNAEDQYHKFEREVKEFVLSNNLPSLEAGKNEASLEYQYLTSTLATLATMLDTSNQQLQRFQQQQHEGKYEFTLTEHAEVEMDPFVARRLEEQRDFDQTIEANTRRYGPNHRYVHALTVQQEEHESMTQNLIDEKLGERFQIKIDSAIKEVDSLEGAHRDMSARLDVSRARMQDLTEKLVLFERLQEEMQLAAERLDIAGDRLREAELLSSRPDALQVRAQLGATIPMLVFPTIPIVVPTITLILLFSVAGIIFLREMLDQRIKNTGDIKLIPNLELLGVLPDAADDPSGIEGIEDAVVNNPAGLLAESFRQIRTTLLTKMDRRGYKTLMITGAKPESGVTTMVGNLAASMTYNGRKVIIVDANFRRPRQHVLFNVPDSPGLIDLLQDQLAIEQAVLHIADPGFDLLPAGIAESAPPELFEGSAFLDLLASLESRYDLILIDTPPTLLTSDSQLLAKQVDAVAMVVRAEMEKRGMIERMDRQLTGYRADILGVILNGVKSNAGGYFRKSYREFYAYRENNKSPERASKAVDHLAEPVSSNESDL